MARLRRSSSALVEPIGADLVALAQAHALDVTTFPHQSLPPVLGADTPPAIWVARAESSGRVVGFIATRANRSALEISGLAVEPAHRRNGIGRALVRAVVRSARKRRFSTVELHVSTGNVEAVALYASERFREAQRVATYYSAPGFPDDGDAWRMIRDVR